MMANIIAVAGRKAPDVASAAFIDPLVRVMGDVSLSEGVSLWAGAILRADDAEVVIGSDTAVLEQALIEAPEGKPVHIGAGCIISHRATVHGATVGDNCLIGIGAIVLDGASIGEGSIVGAGCVVPPRLAVPAHSLVLGLPGKVVRSISEAELAAVARELAALQRKAKEYQRLFG